MRNAKKLRETTRKEKKERRDQLKQEKTENNTANESTVEGNKHHLKPTVDVIMALDRLHRTCALKEMDSLTSKVAKDDVREDIEILSLIRLLRSNRFEEEKEEKEDIEDATSETEAALNDIELVSYTTSPNTSPALSTRASANSSRKRVSMEGLNDETVRLLKGLTAGRQLPEHLTGKQVQENLRAGLRKKSNIIRPKWRL